MPKVTVIIPTYNRSKLLRRAVESILRQTFRDFELIIVNDASTDDTEEVVRYYLKTDLRVKYLENEKNLGHGAGPSFNRAFKIARGKFCALLGDDDEWLKNKLEKQLKVADDFSAVGTRAFFVKEGTRPEDIELLNKKSKALHFIQKVTIQDALSGEGHIIPSTLITKTNYLKQVGGFDGTLAGSTGWDLNVRLIKKFGSAAILSEKLTLIHHEHEYPRVAKAKKYTNYLYNGAWRSFKKHQHLMSLRTKRWRIMCIHTEELLLVSSIKRKIIVIFKLLPYIDLFIIRITILLWKKVRQKLFQNLS